MAVGVEKPSEMQSSCQGWDSLIKAALGNDDDGAAQRNCGATPPSVVDPSPASAPASSPSSGKATRSSALAPSSLTGLRPSSGGYEIRKGHKIVFPKIVALEGETDQASSFRVARECRQSGNDVFKEGTVWAAQAAVDAWGQGLLALERVRNQKYYGTERVVEDRENNTAEAEEACNPSVDDLNDLTVILRSNIGQALLKLRDFESSVVHCDAALELDPSNAKVLWRKAKAVWEIRNPGAAREALHRLLDVDKDNPAAVALLREIDAEEARKYTRRTGMPSAATQMPRQSNAQHRPEVLAAESQPESQPESPHSHGPASGGLQGHWRCCRRYRSKSD